MFELAEDVARLELEFRLLTDQHDPTAMIRDGTHLAPSMFGSPGVFEVELLSASFEESLDLRRNRLSLSRTL